ncbi:MAG TPA: 4Fe-4S dicluster domain-containing protein [Gemmatimonadaceae bacterium]
MTMQRRQFLKSGLVVAGGAAAGVMTASCRSSDDVAKKASPGKDTAATLALTADGDLVVASTPHGVTPRRVGESVRRGVVGKKWVMVIDLAACDGCGKCSEACTKAHFIPSDREYMRIFKMQEAADTAPYWMPRPCFHCDNPPCARVCPVGATFKRDDGIVLIDNERCIGCRFCMAACPFTARSFNWSRPNNPPASETKGYSPEWGYPRRVGTAEKCDFCADMASEGKLPHCSGTCPMGAIYFGDENEDAVTNSKGDTLQLSKLLRDRAGFRYMEDLGTKPRVHYLPPTDRRFPAPGEPGAHTMNMAKGATQR